MLINEMPRYEILDDFAMQELERGWRRIVSELGIEFLYEEALDVFKAAGQNVEGELVKFDPDVVDVFLGLPIEMPQPHDAADERLAS